MGSVLFMGPLVFIGSLIFMGYLVFMGFLVFRGSLVQCLWVVLLLVELYVEGEDVTKLASMVKLKAGRLARVIPDSCLQYWGGMGFTSDVLVSRFFR